MEVVSMAFFDSYVVNHLSGATFEANIRCLSAGSAIADLKFIKDGVALPANASGPPATVHFPISRFNEVIDTLRYEKPLQFKFAQLIGQVGTGAASEPVGEEEA
jgi:hypothetical protein